ncbi:MAG: nicotinamide riboside transporter PnuC [Emcibacter sp.]|nr:nicotinamide riboside transporter PnuC [Emcibacter sp.]
MTINEFIAGFLGASAIEMIASAAGFICVFLLIRRNIWSWGFGLLQVSLFVWVFYQNKLYSDALLHVFYIGFQFYGWWNWMHHKDAKSDLIIVRTTGRDILLWSAVSLCAAVMLGYVMDEYTDASFAYADAFTTATSLVAQFLLTRRHLLNWLFWIAVDIVAIVIYFQKGLYPTSLLYVTFLIMCCIGQYSWWKQYKRQIRASAPEDANHSLV